MAREYSKKPKSPLNGERLEQLALHYAGRYATTRAKLAAYLHRKLRERGWDGAEEGDGAVDVDALVARFAELRYVDDAAFATMRTASLSRRGYGARRVDENLRAAGIDEAEREAAREQAERDQLRAAEAFARKRRLCPFAAYAGDPDTPQKQIAAVLRAGHGFDLARRFVRARPGEAVEE